MKRIITILTAALLVCLLLAGCTPKDAKPTENAATPTLTEQDFRPSPEGTVASGEDGGIEVVDEYTVEIGEGVGFGGN